MSAYANNYWKWVNSKYSAYILEFSRKKNIIKVGLSPFKKVFFYLLQWKPFKNNEKGFLFYLKSSFRPQDIKFLSWHFGHVEEEAA